MSHRDSGLKSELSESVYCIEKSDRTIVNPEPLLALPKKLYVNTRGPSGAAVYLRYTWRFFAKLPGARDIIADFLYPNHTEGMYISLVLVQYGFSSLLWHDFNNTYFITKMNTVEKKLGLIQFWARKLLLLFTEDGSVNALPQILYAQYLILGAFWSYMS